MCSERRRARWHPDVSNKELSRLPRWITYLQVCSLSLVFHWIDPLKEFYCPRCSLLTLIITMWSQPTRMWPPYSKIFPRWRQTQRQLLFCSLLCYDGASSFTVPKGIKDIWLVGWENPSACCLQLDTQPERVNLCHVAPCSESFTDLMGLSEGKHDERTLLINLTSLKEK